VDGALAPQQKLEATRSEMLDAQRGDREASHLPKRSEGMYALLAGVLVFKTPRIIQKHHHGMQYIQEPPE